MKPRRKRPISLPVLIRFYDLSAEIARFIFVVVMKLKLKLENPLLPRHTSSPSSPSFHLLCFLSFQFDTGDIIIDGKSTSICRLLLAKMLIHWFDVLLLSFMGVLLLLVLCCCWHFFLLSCVYLLLSHGICVFSWCCGWWTLCLYGSFMY